MHSITARPQGYERNELVAMAVGQCIKQHRLAVGDRLQLCVAE